MKSFGFKIGLIENFPKYLLDELDHSYSISVHHRSKERKRMKKVYSDIHFRQEFTHLKTSWQIVGQMGVTVCILMKKNILL